MNDAQKVVQDITEDFMMGNYEEIYLAYNRFDGPLTQTPVIEKILPLDVSVFTKSEASSRTKSRQSLKIIRMSLKKKKY